ncbi:MAG: 4-hydroxythreonine-4-phosphate dehydrogenase PdxA [Planctomycetes bacterium]|nr:4-hydroxythreonine-4-phosphate dehydrogenase PdxA [Planctomycetota bacterium]
MPAKELPLLALTLGDPAGIGPEIALRAAVDPRVRAAARLVLIGPRALRVDGIEWVDSAAPERWEMGRVQRVCGEAALAALRIGHELAFTGRVDALVTAPVSKEALHLAGEKVEGQTELLGRWCGVTRFEMLAIAGKLRVMLLTRHMPLRRAIESITTARVLEHLRLFDESLRKLGFAAPRIALAGLNPHAGEHGVLGSEDDELLAPAVASARAEGIDASGPHPPDTIFLAASRGAHDGVLALYHDQAFIPVKLLSGDHGVTVIAGLPYLRVSPVHGTAFDIAGQGKASPENLVAALLQAADWAQVSP